MTDQSPVTLDLPIEQMEEKEKEMNEVAKINEKNVQTEQSAVLQIISQAAKNPDVDIETSAWFGIAAMGVQEPAPTPDDNKSNLAANCALMLQEGAFVKYIQETYPVIINSGVSVENVVNCVLGIKSKSELNTDPLAAQRWRDMRADYQNWLRS